MTGLSLAFEAFRHGELFYYAAVWLTAVLESNIIPTHSKQKVKERELSCILHFLETLQTRLLIHDLVANRNGADICWAVVRQLL